MYNVGDKIIYGVEGVFVVSELTGSPMDKNDDRTFYILKPLFGREDNIIYTPAENGLIPMRAVSLKEDIMSAIEAIADIDEIAVEKEKLRRDCYKAAMKELDIRKYIGIIKSVLRRRAEFAKSKKRLPEADVEYEKKAKFCLCGEMSAAFGMSFEDAEKLLNEKMT